MKTEKANTYSYLGDTIVIKTDYAVIKEVKNKSKKTIYFDVRFVNNDSYIQFYEYDENGNVIRFTETTNGKLIKETTHHYTRNIEDIQMETLFESGYTFESKFNYEYWD